MLHAVPRSVRALPHIQKYFQALSVLELNAQSPVFTGKNYTRQRCFCTTWILHLYKCWGYSVQKAVQRQVANM